ncbi:ferredoxin reductase family protein [Stutzerimonas stutzeri]|uniref:ferredoxin reductase family protein n=1 Tax=Stutzerimonas stutzeri TaxID=316 RepID=UPI001C2EAF91|nr:ferredoxin reductase family protein [Stutzerimonas stutzeri]
MQRIRLAFVTLFIGLSGLWLTAASLAAGDYSRFWPLRADMVQFSGLLAIGAMSAAIYLAIRPRLLERLFDGLDKTYRLHKWLGIAALLISVTHWGWAQVPKWLVDLGWLPPPARHGAGRVQRGVLGWLDAQRGFAEAIGEWAFYLAAILITLALLKRIPYGWFHKIHRWLSVVYLVLVVHSVLLLPPAYWPSLLGVAIAVLLVTGSYAACVSLWRRVGRRHQVVGHISDLTYHQDNRVLQVTIALEGSWPGHQPGQFSFVTFDPKEGSHPFSLSSAWQDDGLLSFSIKGLGDYTRSLPTRLRNGDAVTVEGPYGCFDFAGHKPGQIWIAGGIGIAPFLARLEALAADGRGSGIDLFYCTSAPDQRFIARIRQLADSARISFHLLVASEHGRLTAEHLRQQIPDWQQRDVWFCGPARFGHQLQRDLEGYGLPAADFHQEVFNMR